MGEGSLPLWSHCALDGRLKGGRQQRGPHLLRDEAPDGEGSVGVAIVFCCLCRGVPILRPGGRGEKGGGVGVGVFALRTGQEIYNI